MENLLINNSQEISEIIIVWECTYIEKKKICPIIKSFLELSYKPHIGYRLKPRCAVRGSFTDVFALRWTKTEFPEEKFIFLDANNFYTYVSINYPFMTGKLKVVIGKDLANITITNNQFFYKDQKILGSILLTILPSKNLWLPFLLYRRQKDEKTVVTLCKLCCETESSLCKHSDDQRAFTSTYMITEIEYALTLGYKILHIYEMHVYFDFDFIFKPFMTKLNFLKTKYSNCFAKDQTLNDKSHYCNILNSRMNLQEPFYLTIDNVKSNPTKRNFF